MIILNEKIKNSLRVFEKILLYTLHFHEINFML